jgi:hypothetical protein
VRSTEEFFDELCINSERGSEGEVLCATCGGQWEYVADPPNPPVLARVRSGDLHGLTTCADGGLGYR